jgi:hypothetical protein
MNSWLVLKRWTSRAKGKGLQRDRSEKVERSLAPICETGGARRTRLAGLDKINKRYLMVAATRNPGLLMFSLFGIGKPRTLQTAGDSFSFANSWLGVSLKPLWRGQNRRGALLTGFSTDVSRWAANSRHRDNFVAAPAFTAFSTGC